METRTAFVKTIDQLDASMRAFYRDAKQRVLQGTEVVVTLSDPPKTRPQEKLYHALIGDISHQMGGELANREEAKRILVSAFRIDTLDDADLAPEWKKFGDPVRMKYGLRGEVVLLGLQTRRFSKKLATAFVDWLMAFCAEHDIAPGGTAPAERVEPETGEILT